MSAPASSSSSSSRESSAPSSPEVPKKATKSPSRSPSESKQARRSPTEEYTGPRSCETPEACKSLSSSPEAFKKTRMSPSEEPKGLASTEESRKVVKSPPRFPEVPKEVHQSPSEDLQLSRSRPQGESFKTSLQVLLRRQDLELVKNIEYKEKVERGEIDDDDDDGGGGEGGRERGDREDDRTKEERKERRKENRKETAEEGAAEEHGKSNKAKEASKKTGRGEDSKKRAKEGEKKQSESKKEKDGKTKPETQRKEKAEKKEDKPEERKESGRKKGTEKEKEKCERKVIATQKEEEKVEEEAKVTEREREKSMEKEEEKRADRKVEQNETEEEESKAEKREKKTEVKKTDTEKKKKEATKEGKAKEEREKVRKKEEARTGKEDKQKMNKAEEENRRKMMRGGSKEEKTHGPLYMKRKRAFNPWKEYYFVLDGLLLTYYRSQHQYEHLRGMKGSLDLSLVEAVQPRKAGLMKTHHPFCLSRRNLPSIHLGAATKGEQQRWMAALQAVIQPHRLSCYSSDKTLNTASTAAVASAHATKAATLPARVKSVNSCSSSSTEEELEEEEEEEPGLIQPKKVLKVPIALPLGRMNLGEVKLKKVQKTDVKHESVDEASNVSPSPDSAGDRTQADGERETSPPGELFGVVLKKTRREEETKEASSTSTSTSTSKRPSKQPVIPLNSGKLLVVPEAKSPKASPGLQKRGTPERRKSPSPSLPISKSVQALTKSAEEVKGTHVEISTEAFSSSSSSSTSTITTTTTEGKSKVGGVKLCHAQTSEVKYSDVVAMDEVAAEEEEKEVVVVVGTARQAGEESAKKDMTEKEKGEATEAKPQGKKEKTGSKEAVKEGEGEELREEKDEDEAMKKDPLETPMKVDEERDEGEDQDAVHVDLKESPREMLGAVEDKDFLSNNKSVHCQPADKEDRQGGEESEGTGTSLPDPLQEPLTPATPLTPPASPASSVGSTDSDNVCKASASSSPSPDIATASHKPASPASKLPLSSPKSSPLCSDGRGSGEKAQSSVRDGEGKQQQEEEEAQPCGASRPRSCTNESSASSSFEGGEKKPGKLKRLRDRLKSGASLKEKKEDPASPTEKKRRGSNAFSVFLSGKKGKEGSNKHAGEQVQPQPPREEATCEPCTSPLHEDTPFSESPPAEAMVPTVAMQVTGPPTHHPVTDDLQAREDEFMGYQPSADDALVTRRTVVTDCKSQVITYSRASGDSCHDPPPSIPEKTRVRSRSPNHDVPQSNRPVTYLHQQGMNDEDDDEGEVCQTVDGYITEEQIEALLNAKENREKRKRSNSRSQLLAVPGVVKSTSPPVTAPNTDEWANKRPSFISFSSIDSDESLPATNFLGLERRSSSSGSFKGSTKSREADGDRCFSLSTPESGESLSSEGERPAEPQRRAPRPTDSITANDRVSLTFPEFTVEEEEGLSSPETSKARPAHDDDDDEGMQPNDDEAESETEAAAEHEDFFPVVGGDVKLRQPAAHKAASLDLPTGELRTSGIVGLKEFLKSQEQDNLQEVKSGISRLGHSAAVEKLKQTSSEP